MRKTEGEREIEISNIFLDMLDVQMLLSHEQYTIP